MARMTRSMQRGAAAAAAGLVLVSLAGCVGISDTSLAEGESSAKVDGQRLQTSLDELVRAGFPAALGTLTEADGDRASLASGLGNIEDRRPAAPDGQVRIASNTKMFTATVVMQLVDEGVITLDEPIETYLPGLVKGEGIDAERISIRHLLQHTSGLPEYIATLLGHEDGLARYWSPRDTLDMAFTQPVAFAPGARWEYSNTNYQVLGLLIERITGEPLDRQIDERIVQPLGLTATLLPHGGDRSIEGDHPLGYHPDAATGDLVDTTALDPGATWAAGGMISTPSELNTFMQALFAGELTSAAALKEMLTTVPAEEEVWPGSGYGLGVQSYPLTCGGVAWGHGGDILGYETRNGVNERGDAVTVAVTALPSTVIDPADEEALLDSYRSVFQVMNDALC
ncbi:serine hydrolase domain-containing protein [Arthrobacter sp. NPDC092385]|uniref:serine hydrolase domain-containing protein n=1 Tax=Arthrobacter sp. NPDC092385 TaxID=3363943 RepID=UPI00382E7620